MDNFQFPYGLIFITARKRSLGKGNICAPACHFVHGEVCLNACYDTTPPRPEAGNPPPEQCMLGDTDNKWAVRILLECNLVYFHVHFRKFWQSTGLSYGEYLICLWEMYSFTNTTRHAILNYRYSPLPSRDIVKRTVKGRVNTVSFG